ncbi:hypothetical protein EVAR_91581_1 [Eumeta japonica]|uniref:Secreted protein n=1 Tax=Eumeta variegata TaxID=151549 RepID=A0A4C1XDB7_EUMVA|nr:hypothetical protein EVAR_91581_1 [Eumeta japonica]
MCLEKHVSLPFLKIVIVVTRLLEVGFSQCSTGAIGDTDSVTKHIALRKVQGLILSRVSRLSRMRLVFRYGQCHRTADDDRQQSVTRAVQAVAAGVTYECNAGNVTMSHRTRERPAECLASLSHSTMIGLSCAQH